MKHVHKIYPVRVCFQKHSSNVLTTLLPAAQGQAPRYVFLGCSVLVGDPAH